MFIIRTRAVSRRLYNQLLAGKYIDFRSGQSFERFVTTIALSYKDRLKIPKIESFHESLVVSVKAAIDNCLDDRGLSLKRCYANIIFSEVKDSLETEYREDLRMYATVGTPLDLHGIDLLFRLERAYVGVDLTINPFEKRGKTFLFSNFDMTQSATNAFGKRVAQRLSTLVNKSDNKM